VVDERDGAGATEPGRETAMCLTCGCMQAHLEMGESNIRYEDVKAAADENGRSVAETLDIMERTVATDREDHAEEYAPSS
jgi:hypothetical protein